MAPLDSSDSETLRSGCSSGAVGCLVGAAIPAAVLLTLSPGEQAQGMIFVVPMAGLGLLIGLASGLTGSGDQRQDFGGPATSAAKEPTSDDPQAET